MISNYVVIIIIFVNGVFLSGGRLFRARENKILALESSKNQQCYLSEIMWQQIVK